MVDFTKAKFVAIPRIINDKQNKKGKPRINPQCQQAKKYQVQQIESYIKTLGHETVREIGHGKHMRVKKGLGGIAKPGPLRKVMGNEKYADQYPEIGQRLRPHPTAVFNPLENLT